MRKFILTILLIMSLYCPKVNATPILDIQQQIRSYQIDDLHKIYIHPETFTVEQAYHLYESIEDNDINKMLNNYHTSNTNSLLQYTGGVIDGISFLIQLTRSFSDIEINCLTRPSKMFLDEIFERYKNGEIKKDDSYRIILAIQVLKCIKGLKINK